MGDGHIAYRHHLLSVLYPLKVWSARLRGRVGMLALREHAGAGCSAV